MNKVLGYYSNCQVFDLHRSQCLPPFDIMDGIVFQVHAKKNVKAISSNGSASYTTQFTEGGRVIAPPFSFRVTTIVKQYFLEHV